MIYDDNYYAKLAEQDEATKAAGEALFAFLKDTPQDLWLDLVARLNLDHHDWIAHWMLLQPECDRSVAIALFHEGGGAYSLRNKLSLPEEPLAHQLHAVVLKNLANGFYQTAELSLQAYETRDYRTETRHLRAAIEEVAADPAFDVPEALLDLAGERAPKVPEHLSPDDVAEIWALYAPLDVRVHHLSPGPERDAYDIKRKARAARHTRFNPFTDIPAAVFGMGQRKYFANKETFGDWFAIYLADKDHGKSLLETAKQKQEGPTLHFTDTNAFYILLFFFFCAAFAGWKYLVG